MKNHTAKLFCLTVVVVLGCMTPTKAVDTTTVTGTTVTGTTVTGTTVAGTTVTGTTVAGTTVNGTEVNETEGPTTTATGVTTMKITEPEGNQTDAIATTPAAVTGSKISRVFMGTLKITKVGTNDADFSEELKNPSSNQFKEASQIVCTALIAASNESSLGTAEECEITSFTNGSIVAAFSLTYKAGTTFTAVDLKEKLADRFTNSDNSDITGITVDVNSITVEEAKEPTSKPTVGLSTGAIVGIAVGSAVGGLLLIGILVFCIMKCTGGSNKVSESCQELRPTANQDAEEGKGDGVVVDNK